MNAAEIAAKQWRVAVEMALAQEQSPPRDLLTVRSESIAADPRAQLAAIASFCDLQASDAELDAMERVFRERLIAHVNDPGDPPDFAAAMAVMQPLLQQLGYLPRGEASGAALASASSSAS